MFKYEIITKSNIKMNNKKIIFYWTIVTTFIIVLASIFLKYNMEFYYKNKGLMIDDDKIALLISQEDKKEIISNNKIRIGESTFSYKVISINDKSTHNEIIMKLSSKKDIYSVNDIVDFRIEKTKRNILNEIFKYWRGEI